MLLQPITKHIQSYSPVELRTFIDAAEDVNAKQVYILKDALERTDTQVIEIIDVRMSLANDRTN